MIHVTYAIHVPQRGRHVVPLTVVRWQCGRGLARSHQIGDHGLSGEGLTGGGGVAAVSAEGRGHGARDSDQQPTGCRKCCVSFHGISFRVAELQCAYIQAQCPATGAHRRRLFVDRACIDFGKLLRHSAGSYPPLRNKPCGSVNADAKKNPCGCAQAMDGFGGRRKTLPALEHPIPLFASKISVTHSPPAQAAINQEANIQQHLAPRTLARTTPRSTTCWRASTAKPVRLKNGSAPRPATARRCSAGGRVGELKSGRRRAGRAHHRGGRGGCAWRRNGRRT